MYIFATEKTSDSMPRQKREKSKTGIYHVMLRMNAETPFIWDENQTVPLISWIKVPVIN